VSDRLVYSTEFGKMCPECRAPAHVGKCAVIHSGTSQKTERASSVVIVSLETKGRKGKGVTLIQGVPLGDTELLVFAKQLKARCGCGGTVKDDVIEIQGDWRDFIVEEIKKKNWKVKKR
jgi:translation initiation factor 1